MYKVFEKPEKKPTVQAMIRESDKIIPKVQIDAIALLKMNGYIDQCDKEVGWLGIVEKENNTYTISDVNLIKQDVTSITTDLHERGLQEYANELMAAGKYDMLNKVRCWGHSHVNMDVYASSQDEETFKDYYSACDYFIRIIANKKGKMKLDVADNVRGLVYENLPWSVIYGADLQQAINAYESAKQAIEKELDVLQSTTKEIAKKEIEKCVNSKTTNVSKWSKSYDKKDTWARYDGYDDYDYYQDYYSGYGYFGNDDKNNFPSIKTYIGTNSQCEEFLDEVLSENEIYNFSKIGSKEHLKKMLEDREEFKAYTKKDWGNLLDACDSYVKLLFE